VPALVSPGTLYTSRKEHILANLKGIVARLFEMEDHEMQGDPTFFEMGLDSISIIQVRQMIRNEYDVEVSVKMLFEEASTLNNLATFVDQQLPEPPLTEALLQEPPLLPEVPEWPTAIRPVEDPPSLPETEAAEEEGSQVILPAAEGVAEGDFDLVEKIISTQLQLMAQQLKLFRQASDSSGSLAKNSPGAEPARAERPEKSPASTSPAVSTIPARTDAPQPSTRPAPAVAAHSSGSLPAEAPDLIYQQNLRNFISRLNQKTAKSKAFSRKYRKHFASNRYTAGYSKPLKELMYPIVAERAKGARIWDVDGNEYVDVCQGFGAFLLGYNHPAIEAAILKQAQKGIFLGAFSTLPGEVAELICDMTGVERVAFYNSGTEAIMVTLRLARAYTGKNKVVIFAGSYHGTFDGVLVQKDMFSKDFTPAPKASGIPQKFIDDVLLLDYGTEESLAVIRQHAHELAAVLVEPIQSRRPELQPKAYLLELRKITEELSVPLIFDEIITGFRIHPAGAQHWFGIRADLVTYGKIVGGGLPLGVVAGKAEFMLGIDGGDWNYGDDSQPRFDHRKTFVAGTFCHHPLAMAAAKAILLHLKDEGPELQARLNERTSRFAAELNAFFTEEKLPVSIVHFGSLFQVRSFLDLSLFYYHLISKGIYVWEGMTFFISTAHTDDDIAFFVKAIRETIGDLRREGFLPPVGNTVETKAGS